MRQLRNSFGTLEKTSQWTFQHEGKKKKDTRMDLYDDDGSKEVRRLDLKKLKDVNIFQLVKHKIQVWGRVGFGTILESDGFSPHPFPYVTFPTLT